MRKLQSILPCLCLVYLLLPMAILLPAALAAESPRSQPANGWDASLFNSDRPTTLVVQESTPRDDQVAFLLRPRQLPANPPLPKATGPASPRVVGPVNIIHLQFQDATGDIVPALLCTPKDLKGPYPLVIAIHGFLSNKSQVCYQVAPALAKRGYAILAPDMPCHGERPGSPTQFLDVNDFGRSYPNLRRAVVGVRQLIDLADARPDIKHHAGVTILGYSMGSWISAIVGPSDPRIKTMILMVGGIPEIPPEKVTHPRASAVDPRLAIAHFAGRPILLLNGKKDNLVPPDWADRLFAACPEPKKQTWYDSGHFLPAKAYEDAATWLAERPRIPQKPPAN